MTRRRPTRREQARQVEVFDPLALANLQEVLRERLERAELDDFPPRDFLRAPAKSSGDAE
ncbi:hypothetical protein [Micromonospora sp. CNB394]|uniref:hypothetical protein n=1 Tax=Micromonospora sp. CNB394 TaxID=1169151 RepID=UPI00035C2893|nr:hypothetical protein [Micromonospora sp. CNB394]